jgi:hypothetical protein
MDGHEKAVSALRLPDMIIAGAPRCGTSWLYELADRHPQVEMAKPRNPEPKFFLDDALYARGLDYYSNTWFSDIDAGKIAGEKSTNYLENERAPSRIAQHLPDVKLVFILRDPSERAYSNYRWSRMNGLEQEDFDRALDLELEGTREVPEALRYARPFSYLARGLYCRLLTPWFDRFDREQILCLRFEDIARNARCIAEKLHAFLGVAPRPCDADDIGVVNAARADHEPLMAPGTRSRLERFYATPNRALAELLGDDFEIWSCR